MRFIQFLETKGPSQILVLPSDNDHLNLLQAPHSMSVMQSLEQSLMRRWHDDLLRAAFEGDYSNYITAKAHIITPGHYLPPKQGRCDINIPTAMALSFRSSHLEILKYAVHMM
jgi:hypothetical protein